VGESPSKSDPVWILRMSSVEARVGGPKAVGELCLDSWYPPPAPEAPSALEEARTDALGRELY